MTQLLQVRQAARALGVHENTIRRWEERGLLRAVRLPSGVRRFRPEDIEALRERMFSGFAPLREDEDVVAVKRADRVASFDPEKRARAKQASRDADARALASGEKSAAQLKEENELLAPLARGARVDLSASRSLG